MKPHEWTNRCIADDLELHPEQDPAAVAREWRQVAWAGSWHQQGRAWRRQAKTAAIERLIASAKRTVEAIEGLSEAAEVTAGKLDAFALAWKRLEAS